MRCPAFATVLLFAALVSPAQRATQANPGQNADGLTGTYDVSRALVIGINEYQSVQPLQFARQDANDIADELVKDYGFKEENVVRLIDKKATRDRIRHELNVLARAGRNDRVLIFFAGHGASRNGRGFIVPVDAAINPNDAASYGDSCIPMADLREALDQCPAKHILVLADACFSGFVAGRALAPAAAAELMRRTVKEAISAGTSEEESGEDATLGHGIFTYYVLETLRAKAGAAEGTFTAQELFSAVLNGVLSNTSGRQRPQIFKIEGGSEFVFNAPEATHEVIGGTVTKLNLKAKLSVTSTPSGAEVILDGKEVGVTPYATEFVLDSSPIRKLTVTLRLDGFEPVAAEATLERGTQTPVNMILTALTGGGTTAGLAIGSHKKSATGEVDLVYVPAGEFTMGGTGQYDGKPQHKVFLGAYWIGKNDVTVAQFRAYCEATGYKYDWDANKPSWGWDGHDDHPMVNVSWDEAHAYCQWTGGDLPSEAQWEKAARGIVGWIYPWGNDWDAGKLWCSKAQIGDAKSTAPVGSSPSGASPFGCLDMAGNVWQWCLDRYAKDYDVGYTRNPTGPTSGSNRVLRGGGWSFSDPDFFRCASRATGDPTYRSYVFGFRVAGRL